MGTLSTLPGAVFTPGLVLANLTGVMRTASVRAALDDSMTPPVVLGTVTLLPFQIKRFDAPAESTRGTGLETLFVDQDGSPGDVIVNLTDRDKATHAVLTPLPKFPHHANNGGGHPWSVEPGMDSILVLFNASAGAQVLNLNLGAMESSGAIRYICSRTKPGCCQFGIFIGKVNSQSAPGGIKITTLRGEFSWFTPDQADVFGRVLVTGSRNVESALRFASSWRISFEPQPVVFHKPDSEKVIYVFLKNVSDHDAWVWESNALNDYDLTLTDQEAKLVSMTAKGLFALHEQRRIFFSTLRLKVAVNSSYGNFVELNDSYDLSPGHYVVHVRLRAINQDNFDWDAKNHLTQAEQDIPTASTPIEIKP